MQAVILAAGMGKRLKELTKGNTKCMVKVNGQTIIERALGILDKKRLSRIVLVVGYKSHKLIEYIDTLNIQTPIVYIENPVYDKTNNIYSLSLAKKYLSAEDTILLESDLIFEEKIIDNLLEDSRSTLAVVDKFENWMDGTCVMLDDEDNIIDFIPGKCLNFDQRENYYKTVNIYKFSKNFSVNTYLPFLEAYEKAMGENEYYESVLKLIVMLENQELRAKRLTGQVWYEIDDVQDLHIAESLFAKTKQEKYNQIFSHKGGFWRYPKILSYCAPVNPYYPPQKMIREMNSNYETLLVETPSRDDIDSLLVGKYYNIKKENIIVGNSIEQIFQALKSVLEVEGYQVKFYEQPNIYGECVSKADLKKILEELKEDKVKLVLDETFIDYVHEKEIEGMSLSEEFIREWGKDLFIVQDISKAHGIAGMTVTIMVGADCEVLAKVKRLLGGNILNSYGEFYLQIAERYKKDFAKSLIKIREDKEIFESGLGEIPYLRLLKNPANYIVCEVHERLSKDISSYLLDNNLLIYDLTDKINDGKQYIGMSVRKEEENNLVLYYLKEYADKQI